MLEALATAAAGSAVTGVIGFVLWLVLRRPQEREDRQVETLKTRVDKLEGQRVAKMELDIESARKARGQIRDDIVRVDAQAMKRKDCEEHMEKLDAKWGTRTQEFTAAVLKLERVGERVDAVTKRLENVTEEQIHTQTDLAGLTARVEALKERM